MSQKIRLMTEQSLATQVPGLVGDALTDDPTITQAVASAVGDLAADPAILGNTFPTIQNTRRMSIAQTGAVVLTLDDGRADNYTVAAPIVESVGGRITLGITTDWTGQPGFCTPEQIRDLASRGHEIAWHGRAHLPMSAATPEVRAHEWSGKDLLEDILLGVDDRPVSTALYTHNDSSLRTHQEAFGRFERVFVGTSHPYVHHPKVYDPAFVRGRFSWSKTSGGVSRHTEALEHVRRAASEGSIVTFYTHRVTSSSSANIEQWQLEELVALTAELGIPIVTAREAFPATPSMINHGFEVPALADQSFFAISETDSTNQLESVMDAPQVGFPGERSLRIRGDGTRHPRILAAYPPTHVAAREKITVSARVRMLKTGGTGPGAHISIQQRGVLNQDLGTLQGPHVNSSQGWGQYRFDFTPHEECTHFRIQIGLDRVSGDVFFDHVHCGPTRHGALG